MVLQSRNVFRRLIDDSVLSKYACDKHLFNKHAVGRRVKKVVAGAMVAAVMIEGVFAPITFASAEVDPGELRLTGKEIAPSFYEGGEDVFNICATDTKANPFTGKKYTHNSRYDNTKKFYGIDISQFNPVTDYNKVKKAGIDYAFVRMGMRYAVTGNLGLDSKYNTNMKGLTDAGIKVGVYVYSQAITEKEAVEEADHILNHLGDYPITMPLIFDYEFYSETGPTKGRLYDANLNKNQMTKICMAFCDRIAEAGYTPMLYGNPSMFYYHLYPETIAAKYPIWLANYTTKTTYTGTYEFWQYSSTGNVNGITGNVDCNFWYTDSLEKYSNSFQVGAINNQRYTGEALTPDVKVIDKKGKVLKKGTDYTVAYENNVELGTANVVVTGIGSYEGLSLTTTFKIISPKFESATFTAKTKSSISLEWSDVEGAVKYQILRSNARDGSYAQVGEVTGDVKTYKDTKLESGTEYSYKIRYVGKNSKTVNSPVVTARTTQKETKQAFTLKKYTLKDTPVKTGTAVVTVPKNTYLTYYCKSVNKSGNTWYSVSYKVNGQTYYGYIHEGKAALYQRAKTSVDKLKVLESVSADAKSLVKIKTKGTKVTILEQFNDENNTVWSKITIVVSNKRYIGYVQATKLTLY